ncbi:hypothetical protein EHS25_008469 [Saitozyma podzolica]|uniref:Yos1-like protein n=1 Tax=Saitozyma podzolica TaxID=1890683 RepID=A0A427YPL1_9TREE|nr:hypothetical protein EHS25_008469 [Saitozyma podzolica]
MVFAYFSQMLYVALLLTNAVAILNEERFLAKIGWSNRPSMAANSGFGHVPQNPHVYDGSGLGGAQGEGATVKAKLVNLISATRTLMRLPLIVINVVIVLYELVLG